MRLPYVENPPKFGDDQSQAIVERVQQRRGDAGLLELDLALLHAPLVADGWNSFLGTIRTRTSLSVSIRELAISRVAVLNEAWYEWGHHAPLFRSGDGITDEQVDAVLKTPVHEAASVLDEQHSAVMAYADAMTRDVHVPDPVFERLKKSFNNTEIIEMTATISAYNCVSRFLVALDVGEKNTKSPLER